MEIYDTDGSGTIEIDEFTKMMAALIKERPVKSELTKAFKMYDDDDGGTIDFVNLKKVAEEISKEMKEHVIPDSEVACMIKMADRKYDGKQVDLEDFMHVMELAGLLDNVAPNSPRSPDGVIGNEAMLL